ncbi:MAG: hemolysin family protein [Planctomycetota bacterium]
MVLFVASVVLALVVSGLCSLLEATLLSLTPSQVAGIAEKSPRTGAVWQRFKSNIHRPIAAILVINTASHTIGATVAGSQFEKILDPRYTVAFSVVFTFLMLQLSEILPKTIGVRQNRRIAMVVAFPLAFVTRLLGPIVWLVHLLNRPFEGRAATEKGQATIEEIKALASLARMSKLIGGHQERIIRAASSLGTCKVRDVMIPLDKVACLLASQTPDEALAVARRDPRTRFPVLDGENAHRPVGYVNFKELVFLMEDRPDCDTIGDIVRPIRTVAPGGGMTELFQVLVSDYAHMAMVCDEEGDPLGLVTVEDVMEELIGEMEDEFDHLPSYCRKLSDGTWLVGGGTTLAEVAAEVGIEIAGDEKTLAAWLAARADVAAGHAIRSSGGDSAAAESVCHGGFEFVVRRERRGKALEVAMKPAM